MFGFLIGTACLIGLIATLRRGRCGGGWSRGGGCHGWSSEREARCDRGGWDRGGWDRGREDRDGWQGYRDDAGHHGPSSGGWGSSWSRGRGWGMRAFFHRLSRELDASPAQEKVIRDAFEELQDGMRLGRKSMRDFRDEVSKSFRTEHFDAEVMGDAFGKQDEAITEMRKAMVGALSKVHDVLDTRQRARLADLIDRPFGR